MNLPEVYFQHITFTIAVLLTTILISFILKRSVDVIFYRIRKRFISGYLAAKTKTLRTMLKNIIDAVLFLIASLIILSEWGVNIGPILTGAGIIGLAVSFGSQTLVKDLIAGFFIIFEDQFNVGDRIKVVDKYEGRVDKITLRLTVLKDGKGNHVYIPNSTITTVIKYAD